MITAQQRFNLSLKAAVQPHLKSIGFSKFGANFFRRNGSVVQVINFQTSQRSTKSRREFYINVGLAFDEICQRMDLKVVDRPKEYECQQRGFQSRLELLISNVPERWTLDLNAASDFDEGLSSVMEKLAERIAPIENPATFRKHEWFRIRPTQEFHIQIDYEVGELESAFENLKQLCQRFAGREPLCKPSYWIEELRVPRLSGIS